MVDSIGGGGNSSSGTSAHKAARMFQSANQTIASSSLGTKVEYDSVSFEAGLTADTSANNITVPDSGFYTIAGQVTMQGMPDQERVRMSFQAAGNTVAQTNQHCSGSHTTRVNLTDIQQLSGGDSVHATVTQESGSNKDTLAAEWVTYLAVAKVGSEP